MGIIKTPLEIIKIRTACQLAASVLEMIEPYVKPGVTTGELDRICHEYIVNNLNAIPAPLNYRGFPKATCISVNHVVCHGIPGPKELQDGDIVNIDITVNKDGFFGDTSKTFFAGPPSIMASRLTQVALECLYLGIAQVQPGKHIGNIGAVIQNHAEAHTYSVVREYCGHGIGTAFHESLQILHVGKFNTGVIMEPGMIFTIEPMINAGKKNIKTLPDGWTVVTKDHKLSAQWEHTILVTKNGHEVLTKRKEETNLP